jgi:hypothetical protein
MEWTTLSLTKDAFSLVETSTSNSWIVCMEYVISIGTSCLRWVSRLAIWNRTRQGKVLAAMLQCHNSLSANGIHMSLHNVEYGPFEGAVSSV